MDLNSYRRLDARPWIVALEFKVLILIFKKRRRTTLDHELRIGTRLAGELQRRLLKVIVVNMAVAARPDEITRFEITLLRDHMR